MGSNARCALLLVTGDSDPLVPMQHVKDLEKALLQNGAVGTFKVSVYEGYGHAFAHHPQTDGEREKGELAIKEGVDWMQTHL